MRLSGFILLLLSWLSVSAQNNNCVNQILVTGEYQVLLGKCEDYKYNTLRFKEVILTKSTDSLSSYQKSILSETENWAKRLCKFTAETPIGYYDAEKHLVHDSAFQHEVFLYHFNKGDVIADIGAGSAYFERAISKYSNHLTVYVNEIDSARVAQMEPKFILLDHTDKKSIVFKPVLGNDTSTGLPTGIFNKILIRNTFHHFSQPDEMLQHIKTLLRNDGKLFIVDILSDETEKTPACGQHFTREVFLKYMSTNGFVLINETALQYDEFKLFEFKVAH